MRFSVSKLDRRTFFSLFQNNFGKKYLTKRKINNKIFNLLKNYSCFVCFSLKHGSQIQFPPGQVAQ